QHAYAKRADLLSGDDDGSVDKGLRNEGMGRPGVHKGGGMPSREQMKKLVELVAKGETPGKCQSKNECEAYCGVEERMDECVAFAEKMGFMGREEVEQAKKFRSQGGPGGCKTQEECNKFCNTPENRETCFEFAEDNNLIPKEELARMKEGMVRMRAGLDNAPKEVRECLKSSLGEAIIADIQSGTMVPGPDIGERMRGCFEKFGEQHDMRGVFTNAPPEVSACLKEKLGDQYADVSSGKTDPTPEIADTFRVCFQQMEMTREKWGEQGDDQENREHDREGIGSGGDAQGGPAPEKLRGYLRSAPLPVSACLKEKLGDDFEKLVTGEIFPDRIFGEKMKDCFESFRPDMEGRTDEQNDGMKGRPELDNSNMPPDGRGTERGTSGAESLMPYRKGGDRVQKPPEGNMLSRMSASIKDCVKAKIGDEAFEKLGSAQSPADIYEVIKNCAIQDATQNRGKPEDGMMVRQPKADERMKAQDGEMPQNKEVWMMDKQYPPNNQQNGQMPGNPQMEPVQGGVLPPSFQNGGLFEQPFPARDF
ncbi:MAG: hypothetical protein AAB869_00710, partial [Patescibacteria group bacterium]